MTKNYLMLTPNIVQGLISVSTGNVGWKGGPQTLLPHPASLPHSPLPPPPFPLEYRPSPSK